LVFTNLSVADAMRAALAASPDVAAAQARVDESRSALATARSGAAPSLVSNYAQTPQGNPPGPNITSRQVNTGLQWTIGDFIAFGPAAREAAFTLAAAEADEHAAENAERVKVIGLYFDALKARSIAGARRDALAFATAQRDAAGVRAKAGDAPRLDVVRSEVAVAKAQADLEEAVAADENADDALRVETGAGADALTATTPGALPAINPALFDATGNRIGAVAGASGASRHRRCASGRISDADGQRRLPRRYRFGGAGQRTDDQCEPDAAAGFGRARSHRYGQCESARGASQGRFGRA
jgi:outer membrane protein TolC